MIGEPTDPAVLHVFNAYPAEHRPRMLALRSLIFDVAGSIDGVGEIHETLKWGEPAFLTSQSKSGTTIRIDWKVENPEFYALFFSCQTNLIERFRSEFPGDFEFQGNRALLFSVEAPLPVGPLSKCIARALTYHRDKRKVR